jgi:hypothetical protein
MQKAKIQLSEEELELMRNSQWILTKNRIVDKVSLGLHQLGNRLSTELIQFEDKLPHEFFHTLFKVSKGEKYNGLPYLVLDFPRLFGKEHILAIRILFWWGKYYSVTLHCRGKYCDTVKKKIATRGAPDIKGALLASYSGDEWNHDLDSPDYFPWKSRSWDQPSMEHAAFIKLSLKTPLAQWEEVEQMLYADYQQLLKFLTA